MAKRRKRRHRAGRNTPSPRRRRRARSYRNNPNPPRRRRKRSYYGNRPRRRRGYRRNPPPFMAIGTELMWAGAGFIGTKVVGNFVTPMLGPAIAGPGMRIAIKAGVAYLVAWGGEMMMGRRFFMPLFLGGSAEVLQDIVSTYLKPMFPMLGADEYDMTAYPELSAYPSLSAYPELEMGQEASMYEEAV